MLRAFHWVNKKFPQFIEFDEGQAENSTNNNLLTLGKPRSGKNYFTAFNLEPLLNTGDAKAIVPHCSSKEHLQEITQYLFPNGFYNEREIRRELNTLRENLNDGEYGQHETMEPDLLDVENLELGPRIQYVEDLIEEETNETVKRRLRKVRQLTEETRDKVEKIEKNVLEQEAFDYRFRNAVGKNGPTSHYTMKVYVPISKGMPGDVEIPNFFQPFAVPVDDFVKYDDVEWSLKVVFGDQNFQGSYNLYKKLCDPGEGTFADLKRGVPDDDRDYVEELKYNGEKVELLDPGQSTQSLKSFRQTIGNMFNNTGIVCGSGFNHTLRENLKEDLLADDPEIIVLYTGFLTSSAAKKFVMTYFMETYKSVIAGLGPEEERELDKKFILQFLEGQEAIKKSTQDNNLSTADKNFNRFMWQFMDNCQHLNTDVWLDTKPDNAHSMMVSRSEHQIITKINHDDLRELFGGRPKDVKQKAKRAMKDDDYNQLGELGFGFIDIGNEIITDWIKPQRSKHHPGRKTYGYRLPCPRQCVEDPVPLSNTNFSFLIDALDLDSSQTFTFKQYQDALFKDDWAEAEAEAIEEQDRQLEKEKEKKEEAEEEKEDLQQEMFREKLRRRFIENGHEKPSGGWTQWLREIADEVGVDKTDKTYQNWTKDLRDELEQQEGSGGSIDVDVDEEQLKEELKRKRTFIFGGTSEKKKRYIAKKHLVNEHGLDEDAAAEVAEDVVTDLVIELEAEGILDNHRPQLDGETKDEKWSNYLEEMDFSEEAENAASSSSESETEEDRSDDAEADETEQEAVEDVEYVEVRITSEVPEFKGTDLEVYGPFDEGEVVEVPEDNADILCNRGNATRELEGEESSESKASEDKTEDTDEEEQDNSGGDSGPETEDNVEPPGEEWMCSCGRLNDPNRSVCGKPSCGKTYDELQA